MVGYTSRGLGVSDVPLRFNCRGEIVVITLRQSVQAN
jgi:predicted MPP superfamily phosphohydrolase